MSCSSKLDPKRPPVQANDVSAENDDNVTGTKIASSKPNPTTVDTDKKEKWKMTSASKQSIRSGSNVSFDITASAPGPAPLRVTFSNTNEPTTVATNTYSDTRIARPGAVAVPGPGIASEEKEEEDLFDENSGVSNQRESSPENYSSNFPRETYGKRPFSAFVVLSSSEKLFMSMVRRAPVVDGVIAEEKKKSRKCLIATFVLAIVVVMSVPITLSLVLRKSDTKSFAEHTVTPSFNPTSMPTATPTSDRFQLISAMLMSLGVEYMESPSQRRALLWLADEDPAQIDVDDISNLTDRYALATLYFATGGDSMWLDQLNFLSSDPVCRWNAYIPDFNSTITLERFGFEWQYDIFEVGYKGVFCDESSGMVNGVDLASNNITGTLPNELGLLTYLRHISIWRNHLSGSIPSSFFQLHLMENMMMQENNIMGTFPSEISNFKNLRMFDVAYNNLTGSIHESVGELSLLITLSVGYNRLTGIIPTQINKLAKLHYFDVSSNMLGGSIPFADGSNPELEFFYLLRNNLTGTIPETLFANTKLKYLDLSDNLLTGTLSSNVSNLSDLLDLAFGANKLNGTIPSSIGGNMTKLEILDLRENAFTGTLSDTLENLVNLVWLDISSNRLSGTIPKRFAQAPSRAGLFHRNHFNGSLDFFCDKKPKFASADCFGENPELSCDCCDACCSDKDGCFGPDGCKFTSGFNCQR